MNSLVKTIIVLILLFPRTASAQCPVAGSDSSAAYCWHEGFDLSTLLSADADSGGVFLNPYNDTINPPYDTLSIPGAYTYAYIVSDSGCVNDTASFVVTIQPCQIGGVGEVVNESTVLAYPNPAVDQLMLHSTMADDLVIYDVHGKCVFRQTAPLTPVIDVSGFNPGIYLLLLQQDGVAEFQRFLKTEAP